MKYLLCLMVLYSLSMNISCKAQSGYEPHIEHQYEIFLHSDTLLISLINKNMDADDILKSQRGILSIGFTLDSLGNVMDVKFTYQKNFFLKSENVENLKRELKEKIKFTVSSNAKNYFDLLNKPIIYNFSVPIIALKK